MSTVHAVAAGLSPDNEQARDWARDELSKREYQPQEPNWLTRTAERVMDWFSDTFSGLGDVSQPLTIIFWILVAAVVTAIIIYVARFVRRTPRSEPSEVDFEQSVLGGKPSSAKQFREQARTALAAGDLDGCVVAATRALTRRAFERRLLDDAPSLTAHEVASRLTARFPAHADELRSCTDLFDAIVYGDGHATVEQARAVLELEDEISSAKPATGTDAEAGRFAVPR